jgi:hypothetical protein
MNVAFVSKSIVAVKEKEREIPHTVSAQVRCYPATGLLIPYTLMRSQAVPSKSQGDLLLG